MFRSPTSLARPLALCGALALAASSLAALRPPAAAASTRPNIQPIPASAIMYVARGRLWLAGTDGAPAAQIPTPWPLASDSTTSQEVLRSPHHAYVALDDQKGRLAVINLATRHVTLLLGRQCRGDCYAFNYAWSPNGRYLGFVRPASTGQYGTLLVWDSARRVTRTLLKTISGFASGIDWSHDSTRMLVSTGPYDAIKSIFPSATVVTVSGRARTLGKGVGSGWSPDDRFVGVVRSHQCGANTCDDAELVQPSAGGAQVVLTQHIASTFEDPEWAQRFPVGNIITYGFDRWVLDFEGHIAHRIAGPNERVDSWAPDGLHLAVETYHPYEETPDSLYLSTPGGARVHLHAAGRKNSCGACSKDVYRVIWSQCSTGLIAFSTPEYPTPKLVTVYPQLYLGRLNGSGLNRISVTGSDNASVVGFANRDQDLIVRSGGTLYRYIIGARTLNVIARGVTALATPPISGPACS